MSVLNELRYKQRAEILKAMAHPSRLKMLEALGQGELCVCELQRIVDSDMSTVSRHLSVMKSAGLVEDEKRGLQVFYSLRVNCIEGFFNCVESVLQSRSGAEEVRCAV